MDMVQGGVSSPELHAGHRLGRRPHSSKMERRLVSTGALAAQSHTPPPQAKGKGWDVGGE